jgi:flagellar biosynthesis protein FliQ
MATVRGTFELLFALVLGISALALVAPLVGGLAVALFQLPRQLMHRSPA